RRVWDEARSLGQGGVEMLAHRLALHPAEVQAACKQLESAGHLERRRAVGNAGDFAVLTPQVGPAELAVPFELAAQRVVRERQMLDRMVRFADTAGCRRQNLLRYFGDRDSRETCPSCDSCVGSRAPVPEQLGERPRRARSGGDRTLGEQQEALASEGPYD